MITFNSRNISAGLLIAATFSGFATSAQAVENGVTNWPNGVNTVLPAMMPPQGATQFYGYTIYYSADKFVDGNGDELIPGFGLDVYAQAFRVNHTLDYKTDSGVTFTSGAILSGGKYDLEVSGLDDTETGLNQIYLTPLYVNWSPSESLHLSTGFSGFVPLGDYNANALVNTTSNYESYVQEFDFTWFPSQEWEISMSPTITFNAKNDDTNYESGDLFNLDYFAGYRPSTAPQWQVGVAGHYTKQFTDDKLNGYKVGDGFRLKKFAVGPQVFYAFGPATAVVFKYLHETNVEYGTEGSSLWFQFAMPL